MNENSTADGDCFDRQKVCLFKTTMAPGVCLRLEEMFFLLKPYIIAMSLNHKMLKFLIILEIHATSKQC